MGGEPRYIGKWTVILMEALEFEHFVPQTLLSINTILGHRA